MRRECKALTGVSRRMNARTSSEATALHMVSASRVVASDGALGSERRQRRGTADRADAQGDGESSADHGEHAWPHGGWDGQGPAPSPPPHDAMAPAAGGLFAVRRACSWLSRLWTRAWASSSVVRGGTAGGRGARWLEGSHPLGAVLASAANGRRASQDDAWRGRAGAGRADELTTTNFATSGCVVSSPPGSSSCFVCCVHPRDFATSRLRRAAALLRAASGRPTCCQNAPATLCSAEASCSAAPHAPSRRDRLPGHRRWRAVEPTHQF
ncbi:hypothetical protein K505DRAFT_388728 [Melanomma pulvis-pyrius CBS 109.77]|uniref:Uncharacterized protein n=1 Tax=Melanomma pulvis-pyrius CBS 109.77 TaxID=1314802 RepID=A0A6A6XV55_9PLEO|nr:hypothetical protein K505DRAFT_388728 [Melanomma pulvis-pyrius CBS 109.77]